MVLMDVLSSAADTEKVEYDSTKCLRSKPWISDEKKRHLLKLSNSMGIKKMGMFAYHSFGLIRLFLSLFLVAIYPPIHFKRLA